ncbi:hypothetical protein PV702_28475 [Streptomyces sp. FL06-04B]|uniref:hypothetical protein n=1 Tax=unclassified Streptomyces TaxID=2593676 RepID=UPI0029A658EA|nr:MULTISPECIES: hypothetical protein [unclassified Streptomyces]MDX3610293.1 hypothetical protein [Streptomyces sp. FL06-04B]MDX3737131.1 hypothetical protein [Streptomyces sp. ID01-15D]
MAQYIDNPAGRLHKFLLDLHAAYPNDQQQKQKQAWAAVVELVGNDLGLDGELRIISAVATLPGQVRDAVSQLSVDDERKEHLLLHLDEVERGIGHLLGRQALWHMFSGFATNAEVPRCAAISALSHCSYELHRAMPETVVSDEDLARVIDMINELIDEVHGAKLPEAVKRAMLEHLVALLQAAHNVRVAGTQPLDDALFALVGSLGRTTSDEELAQAGLRERFKNALQTLDLMFSTSQSAGQIGQAIAGILTG